MARPPSAGLLCAARRRGSDRSVRRAGPVPTARRAPALAVDRLVPAVPARDDAARARAVDDVDVRGVAGRVAAVRAGDDERRPRGGADALVPAARRAGLRAGRAVDRAGVRPVPPGRALRPVEVERPGLPRVVTARPRDRA